MSSNYQVYGIYEKDELLYIGATTNSLAVRLGKLYVEYGLLSHYMRSKSRELFSIRCLYQCKSKKTMLHNKKELITQLKPKMN